MDRTRAGLVPLRVGGVERGRARAAPAQRPRADPRRRGSSPRGGRHAAGRHHRADGGDDPPASHGGSGVRAAGGRDPHRRRGQHPARPQGCPAGNPLPVREPRGGHRVRLPGGGGLHAWQRDALLLAGKRAGHQGGTECHRLGNRRHLGRGRGRRHACGDAEGDGRSSRRNDADRACAEVGNRAVFSKSQHARALSHATGGHQADAAPGFPGLVFPWHCLWLCCSRRSTSTAEPKSALETNLR